VYISADFVTWPINPLSWYPPSFTSFSIIIFNYTLHILSFQFRNFKIVYRRYAGLYFCICVDVSDNNLAYLEAIHNFVEVLNEYFHSVCELDLVFNFYKVSAYTSCSTFCFPHCF
jgi:hypothetical protein